MIVPMPQPLTTGLTANRPFQHQIVPVPGQPSLYTDDQLVQQQMLNHRRLLAEWQAHRFQTTVVNRMRRFSVLVCHRRFGKTVLAVKLLDSAAIRSARRGKKNANYVYIAPYRKQAKKLAWSYLKSFALRYPGAEAKEADLEVIYPNGATVSLQGADNPDSLRGPFYDGAILDEVADMRREVWGEVIRPALADRKGWAFFIGTPKGENLFFDVHLQAQERMQAGNPHWYTEIFDVSRTLGFLPQLDAEEVELSRDTMSDAQYRQEWLCDFQASVDNVLITIDAVVRAAGKFLEPTAYHKAPRVIGVDVARYGDDRSVIFKRQGLAAFEPIIIKDINNVELAGRVARLYDDWGADQIFVDGGRGEGVIDVLRSNGYPVIEVQFGSRADDSDHYADKRAEIWDRVADWLRAGGAIPKDPELRRDLTGPTYKFDTSGRMRLESKEDMKVRLGVSPDLGDALACTFASNVILRPQGLDRTDWTPLSHWDTRTDELRSPARTGWTPFNHWDGRGRE